MLCFIKEHGGFRFFYSNALGFFSSSNLNFPETSKVENPKGLNFFFVVKEIFFIRRHGKDKKEFLPLPQPHLQSSGSDNLKKKNRGIQHGSQRSLSCPDIFIYPFVSLEYTDRLQILSLNQLTLEVSLSFISRILMYI